MHRARVLIACALFAVLAALGVILSAVYLLWMIQRVFFGEITNKENAELKDMDGREVLAMVPLVVLAIVMGVKPMTFLRASEQTVTQVKEYVLGKPAPAKVAENHQER